MEKSANVAAKLVTKSYWKDTAKKVLYSIELQGPYVTPNFPMVYDLQFQTYIPSTTFYAEHRPSPGNIDVHGNLYRLDNVLGQVRGVFRGKKIIVWDDASVWNLTPLPVNTSINIYSPQNAFNQATIDSARFNRSYNAAYPNLYASPYSDSLIDYA